MHLPRDDQFSVPPAPKILSKPAVGRVLCFAPHPDDEAVGPGGTLGKHRLQGDPVRIIIATDGSAGDPDGKYEAKTYVQRRRDESRAGMALLDCRDFVFWNFPDSCAITDSDLTQIASKAALEIEAFRPDIIYMPWEGEGNSDHRALYCGVLRGLDQSGYVGTALGYEIWNMMVPDLIVDISDIAERKWAAVREYESQLAYVPYLHPAMGMNAQRSVIFNRGVGYGEAFRMVELGSRSGGRE